eukprot:106223_1
MTQDNDTIWTNISFRIGWIWFNVSILMIVLAFHSYRLCFLQKDRKGSSIRILKYISFRHLSFIVIIAAMLPALQQAIVYTPRIDLSDGICKFTVLFGIVSLSLSKLALHLFVTMRSQITLNESHSIWFKVGLIMIFSDVLYLLYAISGLPTLIVSQENTICKPSHISKSLFIWFGINDFIIGLYCLFVFIMPLRKYIALEDTETNNTTTHNKNQSELKPLVTKIMIFSSIALISTMIVTLISAIANEAGGILFGLDGTINSICVTFQFAVTKFQWHKCCYFQNAAQTLSSIVISSPDVENTTPEGGKGSIKMIIHPEGDYTSNDKNKSDNSKTPTIKKAPSSPSLKKLPSLKKAPSLSLSLVENATETDLQ